MGTANYAREFFSRVYSIDELDEDTGDMQVEDAKSNIIAELDEKVKKIKGLSISEYEGDYLNIRHGGGQVFGSLMDDKYLFGVELLCLGGYYAGVNFDVRLVFDYYGSYNHYNNIDDIISDIESVEERTIKKIERAKIEKRMNRILDIVEKVYSNNTDAKIIVGRFSNGEVVYKSVGDLVK